MRLAGEKRYMTQLCFSFSNQRPARPRVARSRADRQLARAMAQVKTVYRVFANIRQGQTLPLKFKSHLAQGNAGYAWANTSAATPRRKD